MYVRSLRFISTIKKIKKSKSDIFAQPGIYHMTVNHYIALNTLISCQFRSFNMADVAFIKSHLASHLDFPSKVGSYPLVYYYLQNKYCSGYRLFRYLPYLAESSRF